MKVFYIDPQSYNNLSTYDYSLLSQVEEHHIIYYYSDLYQLSHLPGAEQRCRFHYSNKRGPILKALSYAWTLWGIWRDAKRERPDVVHVQWIRLWHLDQIFTKALQRLGIRVIHTAHNLLPHVERPNDFVHYQKYYNLVDRLIVHTEKTRDEMISRMQIPADKIHVIRHGVLHADVDETAVDERMKVLRIRLGISEDAVLFSSLGVQKPYKGTQELVEAWSTSPVLRGNPSCHLLIAGRNHGLDYSPLRDCPNVTILEEMLSDLDFEAYLALTDVLLLPYRKISQSGLVFSAIHRHVPFLCTNVGGLTEILQIGNIGWCIGELSVPALRHQMEHLVGHRDEILAAHSNVSAFLQLEQDYSWETIGKQTAELYRNTR